MSSRQFHPIASVLAHCYAVLLDPSSQPLSSATFRLNVEAGARGRGSRVYYMTGVSAIGFPNAAVQTT